MARANSKDRGIFERPKGSGVWWVRYHDHLSKERRAKIGPKSAALAYYQEQKSKVAQVKRHPELEAKFFGSKKKCVTIQELLKTYFPDVGNAPAGSSERRYAKRWAKLIGHLPVDQISKHHAKKRQAALLERGLKPSSVNRDLAFIKAVLNRALDDGLITENPLHRFKMLRENNVRDRFLLEAEEDRLQIHMEPEDFDLVVIAVDSGLRQAEQFGLTWTQVTFDHGGWFSIIKAKGDKSRTVPMTPRVLEIMRRRFDERTNEFVFSNTKGQPMDGSWFFNKRLKPALAVAKIDGILWHTLRHTTGSRMALAGESLQKIAKILGHSQTRTTERYAHLLPDSSRSAIMSLVRADAKNGLRAVK